MVKVPVDQTRDWYSVSVDTLRAWGLLLVVVSLGVAAFLGYRSWEASALERHASQVIGEARVLMNRLQGQGVVEELRGQYRSGVDSLAEASGAFGRQQFEEALAAGQRARDLFQTLVDIAGGHRSGARAAQLISMDGRVEYRRGDEGEWKEARTRVSLQVGDHVRTGPNGSAEIMFLADRTLYTARPDTQLIISGGRTAAGLRTADTIRMDYGWINLNTADKGGKVATPEAEARVARDSEASVAYDAESRTGRFATYRGEMEVASAGGQRRRVRELEQVIQRAEELGRSQPLPDAPIPQMPEDDVELDLARADRVVLSWSPVAEAARYALQVARGRLFVEPIIDVADRRSTRATVGLRGEGSFLWRVAAVSPSGERGPWSPHRAFRVAAPGGAGPGTGGDDRPPELELEEIRSYGSIFIVEGRTERGASVEINGEPVQVNADGTFTKTVQLADEGWSVIRVLARDAAGNQAEANPRVFVEQL